jgi:hypothetical protein
MTAPVQLDVARPDVAQALHSRAAGFSGYSQAFAVGGLQPGAYRLTVYRRSQKGWLACEAAQPLVWAPRS